MRLTSVECRRPGDGRGGGKGTRYVFTALHRDEADREKNMESGFYEGTEIAIDQLMEHVLAMK